MKKIITLLVLILFAMQLALAQKTKAILSQQALQNFYMQKSTTKTVAGFVLLLAGVAMANEQRNINVNQIPSAQAFSGSTQSNGYGINKKLWLLNYGRAMALSSIPLFISGSKYKERAKSLTYSFK